MPPIQGIIRKEQLTQKWSDWIDYWSVDFDYQSKKEVIQVQDEQGENQARWTGDYIFENEWQSFRTKKNRELELKSHYHEYIEKKRYKIAVKVVDIFGNDTMKVIEINIYNIMKKRVNFFYLFKQNSDGSIEPLKIVRIGGVQMGPGVRFGNGVFFGNINLFEYIGKDFEVEEKDGIVIILGIYK